MYIFVGCLAHVGLCWFMYAIIIYNEIVHGVQRSDRKDNLRIS